ncbi:efflux RND transporter periplasmic adaptor subunit [Alteromonas sp. Cnat2-8]|uniref:efflux RND transporter periplasmic adaptor subunit n=1 Tax=Alteromonas sp. Cnat2-8 TaxID=2917728 RepID=UPI001EF55535|nr:efflux RND transporter periplasmic adaptor subunit [Alteromonas sp. Cnat2-8]MCG7652833.1 efflux RND transporter periplasmic adaptor subunit [Alteromonas sp. Cnat2-8]
MSNATINNTQKVKIFAVGITLLVVAIVVEGTLYRQAHSEEVKAWTEQRQIPTVAVVTPAVEQTSKVIELPARLEAQQATAIFARVDGYVSNWYFDIGSRVEKGAVLAELETPDIDQQMYQANAELERRKVEASLAQSTLNRWLGLAETQVVSQQDVEQKRSEHLAAQSAVKAAQASLQQWKVQKQLARVIAPFSGTIVARNLDVGDLVNAGSSDMPPLFRIVSADKLRVFAEIPQKYAAVVELGSSANLIVPEYDDRVFVAEAVRRTSTVNPLSGTSRVEFSASNQEGLLMPGGYAKIRVTLESPAPVITIPASALIFNAQGLLVATVNEENEIIIKPISLSRDLGRTVEIAQGLNETDRVVTNPPDGVSNKDKVNVVG